MLLIAGLALVASSSSGQESKLSAKDEDRVKRLMKLADALQRVKVDQKSSTGDRSADGRRYSKSSQMHMRFLTAAADLAENQKDGICTFPVQVSGFTNQIDSSKKQDNQKTGSDVQRAEIKLAGLIGQPRPKATVKLPALNHGSTFPADQIARDRIHDLIRLYFPEAEIDGKQRFFEKEIEIQNDSKESIRVWVFGRSWDKSPAKPLEGEQLGRTDEEVKNESGMMVWQWVPGPPERTKPIELTISAGQSRKVQYRDEPLAANRILVWAESETGERWTDHKSEPLWTIEPNAEQNGERTYHATKIATYTYKIEPKPGPRLLTERLLEMKNDTSEPITVKLRYRTNSGTGFTWRDARFTVPPRETLRPTDASGARIRGSRILFTGEAEHRRYNRHEAEPLWMVEETSGRRAYKADKMGVFLYTFESARQSARVSADSAPVMVGTKTIATVKRNDDFEVLGTQDDWVQVAVPVNGERQTGWIKKQNLDLSGGALEKTPDSTRRSVSIAVQDAELKLGTTTLTRLKRGDNYQVLEQNGQWHRIEVMVDGVPRHGWIHESNLGR